MADITSYQPVRRLRSEPTIHTLRFRRGTLAAQGRGLAFLFRPAVTGVAEVPVDDRDGWAASIHRATHCGLPLPQPDTPELLLLVREAWPSAITGTDLVAAIVSRDEPCTITSAMQDGTVFGDGIETDPLPFDHGRTVTVRPAAAQLRLVCTPDQGSDS